MQKYGASINLSAATEPRLVVEEGSESLSMDGATSQKNKCWLRREESTLSESHTCCMPPLSRWPCRDSALRCYCEPMAPAGTPGFLQRGSGRPSLVCVSPLCDKSPCLPPVIWTGHSPLKELSLRTLAWEGGRGCDKEFHILFNSLWGNLCLMNKSTLWNSIFQDTVP